MKLHLGCGKRFIRGFVHVDLDPHPHVDYVRDIRDLSVFESESVELIYVCQAFEYFDRQSAVEVLQEWRRVLKRGGILRLSVPNFAVLSRLYQAGLSLDYLLGTLYGRWLQGSETIYHRTTYDEFSLKKLLSENGFQNCVLWDWRHVEHSHVDDFSQAYFPHMDKDRGILWNLNMEATKAAQ
jgi:ubiquinone/menaquinone biosynthesis C-methylase UbiE